MSSIFLSATLSEHWQKFFEENSFVFSKTENCDFELLKRGDKFALVMKPHLEFSIDFIGQHLIYDKKIAAPKKELLARALGLKSSGIKVLDLTAGLGQDAIFLAKLGCQVHAIERHPLLYFLLKNAWEELPSSRQEKVQFEFSEACSFLSDLRRMEHEKYDAIFYDPMYPEKKKSALPRKEMQVFRTLIGADQDVSMVLEKALSSGVKRVVVKRPRLGPVIELPRGRLPHHTLESKLLRFDVYLNSNEEVL